MKKSRPKKEAPFLLYGRRVIEEFLRSSHDSSSVKKIYHQEGQGRSLLGKLRRACKRADFLELRRREMDALLGGNHQGLVLEFASEGFPLYSKKSPSSVLCLKNGPYLCLDRIQDVQNLGSIFRTAEALGISHVFLSSKCAPLDARAHRAASGASLHLSIYEAGNLNRLFAEAKKAGLWIVSSASKEDYERIFGERAGQAPSAKPPARKRQNSGFVKNGQKDASLSTKKDSKKSPLFLWHKDVRMLPDPTKLLLVIGNEGVGVQPLLLKNSDYILSVRLRGKTSSLNAGVAAGILLDRIIER